MLSVHNAFYTTRNSLWEATKQLNNVTNSVATEKNFISSIPQDTVQISDEAKALTSSDTSVIFKENDTENNQSDSAPVGSGGAVGRASSSSSSLDEQIAKIEKQIAALEKEIATLRKSTDKETQQLVQTKEVQLVALQTQLVTLEEQQISTSLSS
ncbi:MAG: hypothetical protein PHN18_02455 [Sulfurospirillaceae bacterium]|nr:hypothetical protein [Sulfurospirillaceae bacterium]MDD2826654.1 hypothetical protein [Sulfurospirillaceae bacterium]